MPIVELGGWDQPYPGPPAAGTDGTLRYLIDLRQSTDLVELSRLITGAGFDRHSRREIVAAAHARVARETQRDLLATLESLQRDGEITSFQSISIVNSVLVTGTPASLESLRARLDVRGVILESEAAESSVQGPGAQGSAGAFSWGVRAIGAESAWASGIDGSGVVVGIIDAGASANHEQLRDNHLPDPRGWFDPRGGHEQPTDTLLGHGTGVLSVAVGANASGITLGVAPGARWTACIGLPDGRYNNIDLRLCADWMLQTARPDVVISAWKLPESGCDPSLRATLAVWRAAEILAVFPAGNQGPEPGLNHSPANYTELLPDGGRALSVGGVAADGSLYAKSSHGPNACDGATFPDLAAPAEDLVAAYPASRTTYVQTEGTSYAAGLAAGAAALLFAAFPKASAAQVEQALRESASDLGPSGPDNGFGRGRLDVPAALQMLESLLADG